MMTDQRTCLEEILGEADQLIRQRLKDRGLEFPHLVIAVTPEAQVVLRSNVTREALRSFAEDLNKVADDLLETTSAAGPPYENVSSDLLAQRRLAELERIFDAVADGRMTWGQARDAMDEFDQKEQH
jgi:hypothetical protein